MIIIQHIDYVIKILFQSEMLNFCQYFSKFHLILMHIIYPYFDFLYILSTSDISCLMRLACFAGLGGRLLGGIRLYDPYMRLITASCSLRQMMGARVGSSVDCRHLPVSIFHSNIDSDNTQRRNPLSP